MSEELSEELSLGVKYELVGRAHISVVTRSESGIHRRSVVPGCYVNGVWVPTDLTGEGQALVDFAGEVWSPDAVNAYKLANAPPVVVPRDPLDQPLSRIQFEFMVEKLGVGPAIEAALDAMPSDTEEQTNVKILARVLYRSGQEFRRGHNLFTVLAPAIGLTSEQIDAAWIEAAALEW